MKPKMLIAGGGYADIPQIRAAKALGFHVVTSGNKRDDLGHKHADEVRLEDFSNKEAMLALAKSLQIDAICASCNDFSALSAAYVAERMGLPGHDSFAKAEILHHKDRYRQFAMEAGITSPFAVSYSSADAAWEDRDAFCFPVMVKPVDLTGGKGISKVADIRGLRAALDKAFALSRAKRVIIEEFVEGTRHGLSTFLLKGRVVFFFSDNEHYYLNPYLVAAASTPGDVPADAVATLCSQAEDIAEKLGLVEGIFHIQYVLKHEAPVIVEICRRPPGDLYTHFVSLATKVDFPAYIVRAAAGLDCEGLRAASPIGYFARYCVMTSCNGQIRDVRIEELVREKILDECWWWKPGDIVNDYLSYKAGIIFLRFESMHEMLNQMERMPSLVQIKVD